MKIVYIAHCIGAPDQAGIEENLADLRRIIRHINLKFPNIVPLCPYYADVVSMDDNVPYERARGIQNDTAIITSGVISECWLTGPKYSKGMKEETILFAEQGTPVINFLNKF